MEQDPAYPSDELLLDYVRGAAPVDEVRRIEAAARQRPELAAEIALMRGMAAAGESRGSEAVPGELGWARLSRAIEADERAAPVPAARPRPGLWQLAATAAAAVAVWQLAAVPLLTGNGGAPGYAPVAEAPGTGLTATVAFAPDATEAEIRTLLTAIGAGVVGGPSALGLWRIGFADEAARDEGIEALQAEGELVETVQAD
jgi:anti-sigma-K factor RskA